LVESLYSKLYNPTKIAGQRVVERFEGDALDERWTKKLAGGGDTTAMLDAIDGGLQLDLSSTSGNDFLTYAYGDNARHFSHTGSAFIAIMKFGPAGTNRSWFMGVSESETASANYYLIDMRDSETNWSILSSDASTASWLSTGIALDTAKRLWREEINSSNIRAWAENILVATKTTNRPTVAGQPVFSLGTTTTEAVTGNYYYFEVYNT